MLLLGQLHLLLGLLPAPVLLQPLQPHPLPRLLLLLLGPQQVLLPLQLLGLPLPQVPILLLPLLLDPLTLPLHLLQFQELPLELALSLLLPLQLLLPEFGQLLFELGPGLSSPGVLSLLLQLRYALMRLLRPLRMGERGVHAVHALVGGEEVVHTVPDEVHLQDAGHGGPLLGVMAEHVLHQILDRLAATARQGAVLAGADVAHQ
mmetsp:Transcript_35849/g.64044  ORF Transcript_35849/g.64044 Transcript_35849/m.64044 type:complete len:205 (-) Transcript_35849:875-1489(-)